MSLDPERLERFVCELAAQTERWREYLRPAASERIYELIWDDADVNAWIICWNQGGDTGYHDHDRSAAAITVLEGAIVDERLCLGRPALGRVHGAGATFTIAPNAIHRVRHAGAGTALTIHAYSPPLVRTGTYRVAPDGRLERDAQGVEAELKAEPARALS